MAQITVDKEKRTTFCQEQYISRLSLYRSVLSEDFGPESDVNALVEFEPGFTPGLFGIAPMERELAALFDGRKVDLRTLQDLGRYFRQSVL